MEPHTTYHHHRVEINPADMLVLYSDGLTGALNAHGQSFGTERLDHAIQSSAREGAAPTKGAVIAGLEDFLGERQPEDDLTLLVIERLVSG
jgi:serine phosphatase RsbU (regulator of sigma subunit)